MPTDHAFQAPTESAQLKVEISIERGFQLERKFQLNSSFKSYMYGTVRSGDPAGADDRLGDRRDSRFR